MSKKRKKSAFAAAIEALTDRETGQATGDRKAVDTPAAEKPAVEKPAVQQPGAEREERSRAAVDVVAARRLAAGKADAGFPRQGTVAVRSLRIRVDHSTSSEVVGGLVEGDQVTILATWTDGTDTWARLAEGWAAMIYDGETYIRMS